MSANNSSAGDLQLTIGSSVFTTSILDNPTASAFRSLLPLDLRMSDLNGNEKHADLPTALPTASTDPGSIRAGDLMLYGSRTLVLWYEDYSTTYTYTRIGVIEDSEGLVAAVGEGQIDIRFAIEGISVSDPTPSSNQASSVKVSSYGWPLMIFLCLMYVLIY
ncbi:hypothetical protein FOPG_16883 [Fusarium oxysporum f. sp. conglutinans race 2 54008]|uniref:Cyclophilin-like domain-containing protein n=2 Tax=Fusarium oxysporum f. sp. conglutinans TaxID=100902 RepID=A0A8H6GVN6_FUSOX|nr:hypothetical protein FOPG_16883 [Fusarium oxysporum f. sp. conglutinans race 2 54008]KAF6525629.1 hypothetical protein HZS61_011424 [Fusarium oxysporum f. sp. conglutinans]KAG6996256.1 hypothetical protein FocnCong_v015165 [Fusarium oxysporum f. sp. conglutinans]KAI8411173.1 hypothetical protein FOFC_07767 [Fusarium oxysporum]